MYCVILTLKVVYILHTTTVLRFFVSNVQAEQSQAAGRLPVGRRSVASFVWDQDEWRFQRSCSVLIGIHTPIATGEGQPVLVLLLECVVSG